MLTWTLIFGFIYYIALSPQLGRFGDAGTVVLDYVGGAKTGKWVVAFLLSVHVLESLYTAYLCVKHRTPLFIGVSNRSAPRPFPRHLTAFIYRSYGRPQR
jgi:hypothetical protein